MKTFRIGCSEDDQIKKGIPVSYYYGSERLPNWAIVLGGDESFKIIPLAPTDPRNDGPYYRIAETLEPVFGDQLIILEEDISPSDALVLIRARELTSGTSYWEGGFRKFEEFPGEVLTWARVEGEEDLLPIDHLLVVVPADTLFRILSADDEKEEQYYYWSGEEMVRTIPEV